MKDTIMTRAILEKAKAHEWLYRFLIEGDPCTATQRDSSVIHADISWSAKVALDGLRKDIQSMATDLVKAKGPEFWYEVFGDARSQCPFAIEGQCDLYHPNRDDQCGYLYLCGGWDDPYVCLRTKLAERTHPDLVELPPDHRRGLEELEPEGQGPWPEWDAEALEEQYGEYLDRCREEQEEGKPSAAADERG